MHAAIERPTGLVVVAGDVVVGPIRVCGEIALDEVASLVGREVEDNVKKIDVKVVVMIAATCENTSVKLRKRTEPLLSNE